MAADLEVRAMARGRTRKDELRRTWRRLVSQRRVMRAYRTVFMHNGQLTEAGAIVLADLARVAGVGKARPAAPGDELRFREGLRAMFLHVGAKLDAKALEHLANKLAAISRQTRETDSDE